jgi:hypothetical protein
MGRALDLALPVEIRSDSPLQQHEKESLFCQPSERILGESSDVIWPTLRSHSSLTPSFAKGNPKRRIAMGFASEVLSL